MDDLRYLNDYVTVELLFQQARQTIMKVAVFSLFSCTVLSLPVSFSCTHKQARAHTHTHTHTHSHTQCEIQTDDETIFELAACAMQTHYGDFRTLVKPLTEHTHT